MEIPGPKYLCRHMSQSITVCFTTHYLNPECKRKSSFINQLYIKLGRQLYPHALCCYDSSTNYGTHFSQKGTAQWQNYRILFTNIYYLRLIFFNCEFNEKKTEKLKIVVHKFSPKPPRSCKNFQYF